MNIILLNGTSSSGKTTIAKNLQNLLSEPYIILGLDLIISTMPEKLNDYKGDLKPREGFGWVNKRDNNGNILNYLTPGEFGKKIYNMLKKQVENFANEGFNIIVDHVSIMEDDYILWKETLQNHNLIICGITASEAILAKREAERGDRIIGVSRAHHINVHKNFKYDIWVDTTEISPQIAAEKIVYYVKN